MPLCRDKVGQGVVQFECSLQDKHDGPHLAVENTRSVRQRKEWEDARAELARFQGDPKTAGEGLMAPGSQTASPFIEEAPKPTRLVDMAEELEASMMAEELEASMKRHPTNMKAEPLVALTETVTFKVSFGALEKRGEHINKLAHDLDGVMRKEGMDTLPEYVSLRQALLDAFS